MVSSLVKTIYTGDFWRQSLTIIAGVPHDISGRSDKKCELTPQSYVPNVTQLRPMALPFKSIALFDGEPAFKFNLFYPPVALYCSSRKNPRFQDDKVYDAVNGGACFSQLRFQ